mmetsp:Transcript_10081/g.10020  ORF Transcript_10081/g.10020 Transcript_10081/m.10020 type:complete len:209 (+) Transcript_10081:546-1172(+)
MGFPFGQILNALPQGGQTQVNLFGLLQGLPSGTSLRYSLTPSQIHQVELGLLHRAIRILLHILKHQDCVAPGGALILIGRGDGTGPLAYHEELEEVFGAGHEDRIAVQDQDGPILLLPQLQTLHLRRVRSEQIIQALIVDLKVIDFDFELGVVDFDLLIDVHEDLVDGPGDDPIEGLRLNGHHNVLVGHPLLDHLHHLVWPKHCERLP